MAALNELGVLPTRNFQSGHFEDAYKLSGQYLVEAGYLKRRMSCYSCPVACHRYTEVDEGKYAGTYSGGPEYETLAVFGAGCGISDTEAVLKANELCNLYGLDTISTGSVIQWLIESNTRGVLSEGQLDGLKLEWGNAETTLELIRRIAYREGVGDLLAEGVRAAASEVGRGSEKWAIEAKGLEQSRVETRSAKAYALAFAVNPRGPDHLHSQPIAEFGIRPLGVDLIERITGSRDYANPYITDKRAEIVVYHEDWYAAVDSLGLCTFPTTADFAISPEVMAGLLSAAVGAEISEDEMLEAGRRIVTLEKSFNVREGATRADDRLPWRLMHEENPDREGAINSPEELNKMLDEYYALHGWDQETSWPTRETLESLDLSGVADELAGLNKLPVDGIGG
jgi:aldehyde:ferredoxin oxidoreductase